ncbi:MAG TPA: alpha-galactosidase [Anaerolineaceae bacterium]|nr:alpha-galactosidase [Anaerolineaceae bacterium]HPN51982.1 alpha-galactosidase [Anaerolineaceae bacterium]
MTKIAFIGAGSLGFTSELVRDILTFPLLQDAQIALMDIDPERLDFALTAVTKIITEGHYPARVSATLDRVEALKDADVVLTTILSGSTEVWRHDIEIPKKFGVDINVGDTRGPSGIFRFLRTLPPMLDIVRDMEKHCPKAILLNYTNPMAMLCGALQRLTFIPVTGLCHSVQGTAMMLAEWIGAPYGEITYTCAGINHMAWYVDYKWNGEDAYPLIHKAITTRPEIYNTEIVRNEMYLAMGKYVTESSGHNSEYNAWFRKRPDLIEKYCTHGTGWNPGEYAYILREYQHTEKTWKEGVRVRLAEPLTHDDLERGQEYAAYIINALMGGEMFKFNGNVPNTGLVTNLPQGACVEVPVLVDKAGFHPMHVGALPAECALLTGLSSGIEELAIQGALTGDPNAIFRAIAHDPLTSAVLSLAEIRQMTNELFAQHKDYLPQFKIHSV